MPHIIVSKDKVNICINGHFYNNINFIDEEEEEPEWMNDDVTEFKKTKVEFKSIPLELMKKSDVAMNGREKEDVYNLEGSDFNSPVKMAKSSFFSFSKTSRSASLSCMAAPKTYFSASSL